MPIQKTEQLPLSYLHPLVELEGEAQQNAADFSAVYSVEVLTAQHYATCRLLKKVVALKTVEVTTAAGKPIAAVVHGSRDAAGVPTGGIVPYLCWEGEWLCLVATRGSYKVNATFEVPYTSALAQGLSFDLPSVHATTTRLIFHVPERETSIAITPALETKSVPKPEGLTGPRTSVQCILAPTTSMSIKWTKVAPTAESSASSSAKEAPKERVMTCGQEIKHSISAGVLVSCVDFTYRISNGGVSKFDIAVDGTHGSTKEGHGPMAESSRMKVLRVEGPGIKTWNVADTPGNPRAQIISVELDTAIEGHQKLSVMSELALAGTTCTLQVPTFTPLSVNRSRGSIAIQGVTSVEIKEASVRGLSKVDRRELPTGLKDIGNVLHAYKFLNPSFTLALQVTKHIDMEVLVAVAEQAIYDITHTGTHLLYSTFFRIRNTQAQFAKMDIPRGCVLWSAMVGSEPVKPAVNQENQILLPLLKTTESSFSVEVVFVGAVPNMIEDTHDIHRVSVELPKINLPVNHLFLTIWMPRDYTYEDWVGDLKETTHFSAAPQRSLTNQPHIQLYHQWNSKNTYKSKAPVRKNVFSTSSMMKKEAKPRAPQRQRQMNRRLSLDFYGGEECEQEIMDDSCSSGSDRSVSDDDMDKGKDADGGGEEMVAGIKPLKLKMDVMRVGPSFYFEKLLVNPLEGFTVRTQYRAEERRRFRKQLTEGANNCACAIM